MNLQRLTIGQMASLNRVTTQTLRYYDRKGLLKPYCTDRENGYRYYHINQCARLDMIKYLQSTGASLADIKTILKGVHNTDLLLKLLSDRLAMIELDIARAHQKKEAVTKLIANYQKYQKMTFDDDLFLEYQPKRNIYSYRTAFNYFEQGVTGYEMMMSELRRLFDSEHLPICYFCNVGTIMRKKYIDQNQLFSDEVFFFADEAFSNRVNREEIAENWYLCVCSEDFAKEGELALKLIANAGERGYQIIGDYLCEVILEFPDFNEKPRNLYYKLQIPVSRA